jgi:hypothetical protein
MKANMESIYNELKAAGLIGLEEIKEISISNDAKCFENSKEGHIDFAGRKLDYIIMDVADDEEIDEMGNSKSPLVCFEYDGKEIKNIWTVLAV